VHIARARINQGASREFSHQKKKGGHEWPPFLDFLAGGRLSSPCVTVKTQERVCKKKGRLAPARKCGNFLTSTHPHRGDAEEPEMAIEPQQLPLPLTLTARDEAVANFMTEARNGSADV
jgi:hypothetical protein